MQFLDFLEEWLILAAFRHLARLTALPEFPHCVMDHFFGRSGSNISQSYTEKWSDQPYNGSGHSLAMYKIETT